MAPTLHHLSLASNLFNISNPLDQLSHPILIFTIQPYFIIPVHINRTPKHTRPLQMRRIEMRVANDNRLQAPFFLDEINRFRIQESDAVPKDVSTGCLE